jgi:CheY-like chemotaxis protein
MIEPFALVIEDDLDASDIFSKALEAAGCKTEIIGKGDEALQRLQECTPTLIVLDLHLPNLDGTSILTQMRQDERHAKTIVMLATADPRMAETVKDLADLVLLKPVTFTQVRDFAVRLLRRVELEQAAASPATPADTSNNPEVAAPAAPPPAPESVPAVAAAAPPVPEVVVPAATAPSAVPSAPVITEAPVVSAAPPVVSAPPSTESVPASVLPPAPPVPTAPPVPAPPPVPTAPPVSEPVIKPE